MIRTIKYHLTTIRFLSMLGALSLGFVATIPTLAIAEADVKIVRDPAPASLAEDRIEDVDSMESVVPAASVKEAKETVPPASIKQEKPQPTKVGQSDVDLGRRGRVRVPTARVRQGPSTKNRIIGTATYGQEIEVIATERNPKQEKWFFVQFLYEKNKENGWVYSSLIELFQVNTFKPSVAAAGVSTVGTKEPLEEEAEVAEVRSDVNVQDADIEDVDASVAIEEPAPEIEAMASVFPLEERASTNPSDDWEAYTLRELSDVNSGSSTIALVLHPGFATASGALGDALSDPGFSILATASIQVLYPLYLDLSYGFAPLRPSTNLQSFGGGFRLAHYFYDNLLPYVGFKALYESLSGNHFGVIGEVGFAWHFGEQELGAAIGPFFQYHQVFVDNPGSLTLLVFGLGFTFTQPLDLPY